jgi:hypothetical protein
MENALENKIATAARLMMQAGRSDLEIERRTGIDPLQLLELRAVAASAPMDAKRPPFQRP